jgi:phage recombination protein Bet
MHEYSESEWRYIQTRWDLTDLEMDVFMGAAKRYELNPLANQIYPQMRNDRKSGRRQMTITTGIDGYRTLADRTGTYAGNDDPVFDDPDGVPKKATVTVYKVVGGVRCAFSATARWDQYVPQGGLDFMWRKMPHLMLGKVAEALALRKAFPAAIAGIYTVEEMEQAGPPLNAEDVERPATGQAAPKPAPQRPVPKEAKPQKKSKDFTPEVETPKAAFVRMLGEWSGLEGKALMERCKEVMSVHQVPTDGTAEPVDFLCCINFCEKYSGEMSVADALDMMRQSASDQADVAADEAEEDEF